MDPNVPIGRTVENGFLEGIGFALGAGVVTATVLELVGEPLKRSTHELVRRNPLRVRRRRRPRKEGTR